MSILVQPVKNPMTKVSKILSLVALIAAFDTVSTRAVAQEAGEIAVRREEKAIVLRKTLEAAATAAKQGDQTSAAKAYEDAWNLTEELGSNVEKERGITIEGFTSSRLALAYAAAKAGDYKEADLQIKRLLKVDPNHVKAKNFKRENDQRLANLVGRVPSDEALSYIGQDKTNKLAAAIAVQDGKLAFEMGSFDRADQVGQALVVLSLEVLGLDMVGVDLEQTLDLKVGLFVVTRLGRCIGQSQTAGSETLDRDAALLFDVGSQFLGQVPCVFVGFGRRSLIALLGSSGGSLQRLAQDNGFFFAPYGDLTGFLRHGAGGDGIERGNECDETQDLRDFRHGVLHGLD